MEKTRCEMAVSGLVKMKAGEERGAYKMKWPICTAAWG
jgi:hypothetical protein